MTDEKKTQEVGLGVHDSLGDISKGKKYYGDSFTSYTPKEQINEMLSAFKQCYFEVRNTCEKPKIKTVLETFNNQSYPHTFYPRIDYASLWIRKWNEEFEHQKTIQFIDEQREELQQKDKTNLEYTDEILERNTRSLGGELLADAMSMLKNDQENPDEMNNQELLKRRNYIINVLSHTTRLVHGKASLMLKASEEKRNTASFLMTLLAKATSGTLSDGEISLLEGTYKNTEAKRLETEAKRLSIEQPQTQNG